MSLLTVSQAVAREAGIQIPSSIVGNSDATAVTLLGLANDVGQFIADRHDWQVLHKEATFATQAQEVQASLPADFKKYVNGSMFDRSRQWQIYGPISAKDWQREKGYFIQQVHNYFRVRGNDILFTPTPAAGNQIYYEYVSSQWVDTNADGAGDASAFAADANVPLLDEDLLKAGMLARYLERTGHAYAERFRAFEIRLANAAMRDGGRRKLDGASRTVIDPQNPYLPEGNWNL